jgi:hypothetical protein
MKTLRVFVCPVVSPSISVEWMEDCDQKIKRDLWYTKVKEVVINPYSTFFDDYRDLRKVLKEEDIEIQLDSGLCVEELLTCPCEMVRKVAKRYVELKNGS